MLVNYEQFVLKCYRKLLKNRFAKYDKYWCVKTKKGQDMTIEGF